MVRSLLELFRRIVREELASVRKPQLGIVTKVYLREDENSSNNYEIDVRLKYEELVLKKVPLAVEFTGLMVLPRLDELVLVDFINGDLQQPFIAHRFYSDTVKAPICKDGDDALVIEYRYEENKKKNIIKMTKDGSIKIVQNAADAENGDVKGDMKISIINGGLSIGNEKMSIEIASGGALTIGKNKDNEITFYCKKLTINGDAMFVNGSSTTISGNTITGS